MRYSPGSLLLVVSASAADRDRFIDRVIEEKGAVFTLSKIRRLVEGRVAGRGARPARGRAAAGRGRQAPRGGGDRGHRGRGLGADERERWVRLAHAQRRPRTSSCSRPPRSTSARTTRAPLNELRTALDAGDLGAEGFQTAMRLGGASIGELKRIVFRPAPRDD